MKPTNVIKWKIVHTLKPRWFEYGVYIHSLPFNAMSAYAGYVFTHDLYTTIVAAFAPQITEYCFFRMIESGIIGPKVNDENVLKKEFNKTPKALLLKSRFKDKLYDSLYKAITFIENQQQKDGSWRDFYSKYHGQSVDWVTAYVSNRLIETGVAPRHLKKTAKFLVNRQKNGGWGYNEIAQQDADSTANVLEFLSNYKNAYKNEINDGLQFLLSHQTENGGFKTYIENNLRKSERFSGEISLDGWCSECIDVTINAINTLDKFEEYDLSKVKAEKYLEDKVKENDIHSYWWESDIPMKIGAIKSDTGKIIELYEMQDNNMSHYIRAMFLSALDDSNIKLRKNLAEKLIYSQRQDGSWESGAILRFPHPSNEEPWNNDLMWRDPGKDQNRIYTTATIMATLSLYGRYL
ncbi:TPA: terpene cyclase/mutase family protein [Candidatus Woesearchaeota archaeon]|nr:hypothetical protein [uncultured archaeon]MBS3173009.1 terpene cyclase/mutase family protein [Candidatus Woesearchaeota archaeon]AQS32917.1 hypothetical protein [uncultured archaeon]AQS34602.1 hypothetical protein [uncultured archaeon]HIH31901.1 terpene cyclase/mutase family protein [Candidatus Woesearchaeota archaeon]